MFSCHHTRRVVLSIVIVSLLFMTPPSRSNASDPINTEALEKMGVNEYHDAGIRGQGIKVAVIDIQYQGLQATIDAGELPGNMITRRLTADMRWETTLTDGSESNDPDEEREKGPHGVACAEIIHDIVPEATLYLIQFEDGDDEDQYGSTGDRFQMVFDYLHSQEVKIASMSLAYFGEGFGDGRGEIFDVIRAAEDEYGILLIEGAGNYAQNQYLQQPFSDSDGDGSHEFFDPVWILPPDERMTFRVGEDLTGPDRSGVPIFLNWRDWGANPSAPSAGIDLDLYVEDLLGHVLAESTNIQDGDDAPVETIDFRPDDAGLYFLRIKSKGDNSVVGTDFRLFVLHPTWIQFSTLNANIASPTDSFDTVSVGAVSVATDLVETYSSRGPTQDGRVKPDIASYARVSTFSYPRADYRDGFAGTSAATPHVAGLAALVLQQNPSFGPDEIRVLLKDSAKDIGNPMAVGSGIAQLPPLQLQVRILSPTEAAPVSAGSPSLPTKTTLRLSVERANGDPVSGLGVSSFTVAIGGRSASIATVREVSESYLLEVIPPTQAAEGLYDLEVTVNDVTATEANAVLYAGGSLYVGSDVVLAIDKSGSMFGTKIAAALSAATMFVDQMSGGDAVGVVSFDYAAYLNYPLTVIDPAAPDEVKDAAQAAIAEIISGGGTDISTALSLSAHVLDDGRLEAPPVVILLSDGLSSWLPIDAVLTTIENRIRVFTIGLGSDVDAQILQQIAQRTGGTYYFSPSESELAEIYTQISGQATGRQIVESINATLEVGSIFSETVRVDQHISELVVSANWPESSTTLQLQLEDPSGQLISPETAADFPEVTYASGNGYATYTINQPETGDWRCLIFVETTASGDPIAPDTIPISLSIQGRSDLTLDADFRKNAYQQGEMIGLQVSLSRNTAITGARIMTEIVLPDGTTQTMPANDDGEHGDGRPGDGVYGVVFFKTSQLGTYRFNLTATGRSDVGEAFTRFTSISTIVESSTDSDYDGLPDTWESMFGTDRSTNDANVDYDEDGLLNIDEYRNGTDPFIWDTDGDRLSDGSEVAQYGTLPTVADTDHGGTPDGIEILKGRDPLDPLDDQVVFRGYLPIITRP